MLLHEDLIREVVGCGMMKINKTISHRTRDSVVDQIKSCLCMELRRSLRKQLPNVKMPYALTGNIQEH